MDLPVLLPLPGGLDKGTRGGLSSSLSFLFLSPISLTWSLSVLFLLPIPLISDPGRHDTARGVQHDLYMVDVLLQKSGIVCRYLLLPDQSDLSLVDRACVWVEILQRVTQLRW